MATVKVTHVFAPGLEDCEHDFETGDVLEGSDPPQADRRCRKCTRHDLVAVQ